MAKYDKESLDQIASRYGTVSAWRSNDYAAYMASTRLNKTEHKARCLGKYRVAAPKVVDRTDRPKTSHLLIRESRPRASMGHILADAALYETRTAYRLDKRSTYRDFIRLNKPDRDRIARYFAPDILYTPEALWLYGIQYRSMAEWTQHHPKQVSAAYRYRRKNLDWFNALLSIMHACPRIEPQPHGIQIC